jgi:uncharacterized protein
LEGEPLDSGIGDMQGHGIRGGQKLFSYVRYNAELSRAGLDWLGLPNVDPAHVHPMDAVEFLDEVQQIGIALAERKVRREHFAQLIPEPLMQSNQ